MYHHERDIWDRPPGGLWILIELIPEVGPEFNPELTLYP